ncbi:MAG: tetratricopeptide repeat protein, partial [Chitinophagales bacterium]|nr:tetratricopeptide repeat protein [Chitinophagales bacterium]
FRRAAKEYEIKLSNAEHDGPEALKLLLQCSFCYAHVQLQKGMALADEAITLAEKSKNISSLAQALCVKAINQFRIGYMQQAHENVQRALSLFEAQDDKEGTADALWLMGTMVEFLQGKGEEHHHHQQKALICYEQLGDFTGVYLARIQQNSLLLFQFQFAEVIQRQEIILNELTEQNQQHLKCYCYMELVRAFFLKREIPILISRMEEWKNLADATGNFYDYTMAKSMLTECYRVQHLDKVVIQNCIESLACCEQLGSLHGESTMQLILANICHEQSQYVDAINYYRKADEIALSIGAPYKHLCSLNGIGLALLKSGDYLQAQKTFETVLREAKRTNDRMNLIATLRHLAELAYEQKDFSLAFRSYKNLFDTIGSDGLIVQDFGRYAQSLGKASDADIIESGVALNGRNELRLGYLLQYLELSRKEQNKREEASAYNALAGYYEETGDLTEAMRFSKQYINFYESMMNEQNINAISGLRMQYESEKKDQEILLLKKEKSETLLQERLRVSRDLHDDMGASISSISILSTVAKQHLDEKRIREAGEMMDQISSDARDMVNNLSDFVWMINPQNDNLEKLFDRVFSYANHVLSSKNVAIKLYCDEELKTIVPSIEARKNIYLLMKEALNNASKYSKCTEATISFFKNNEEIKFSVTDNGKGFDLSNISNGSGLGNMKQREAALRGNLIINSTLNNGTEVSLISSLNNIEGSVLQSKLN